MKKKLFKSRRYGKKIETPIVVEEPIKKEKKSKKKVEKDVKPSTDSN